jgi:3-hydroxyisobutyrate dehydrogenase-like beta-hydroxyacid dehydrogenase
MDKVMKVGFIGLGHMGAGMAANLLKAGHEVTVWDRTAGKERPLTEHGAAAAAHVAVRGRSRHHDAGG